MGPAENQPGPAWCDQLADSLAAAAGMDATLLTRRLEGRLLKLARDVAHGTERVNAPLATFVAGRYVQARVAQGVDAETALSEVLRSAATLLPPDPGATP